MQPVFGSVEVPTVFEVGPYRLDVDAGAFIYAGNPTGLGPRAVAVLKALVERANEYVPKARLIEAAWPGVVVEEGNLAAQIAAIRRVLAASDGKVRIETLARRGYRLVASVTPIADGQSAGSATRATRLPSSLTSFVGRQRELHDIGLLLQRCRLLTLVGIGGIGKTRLALQAAAKAKIAFRDDAWFVDLGPLRDARLVPSAVAQVLGVQEATGKTLIEALGQYLRHRRLLLVLDNCEHLLSASAELTDAILQAADDVVIIATSREPLGVAGEQVYPIHALELPCDVMDAQAVHRSEAVQLFVERVRRQLPDFQLTAQRTATVAEICIRLDGIPLALEFAAARARSLAIEQIHARLDDRFRLLAVIPASASTRHRTLRAVLDWSYDLLREDERKTLARLSIFPGSFSLEAASAVATDGGIDEFGVIDVLSRLVGRSLVVADTASSVTRYVLLETTRAYAAEKLDEASETESTQRRHAQFFDRFFEGAPRNSLRLSDAAFLDRYGPELDNVRAALDVMSSIEREPLLLISLAARSAPLFLVIGAYVEGAGRLQDALARSVDLTPQPLQALAWFELGRLLDVSPARAADAFRRAADLYRSVGDDVGLGLALARLGRELASQGRLDEAESVLARARPLLEPAGPEYFVVYLHNAARLRSQANDPAAAREFYKQALDIERSLDREYNVWANLLNLANAAWNLGDLDAAAGSYRELLERIRSSSTSDRRMRDHRMLGYALLNAAHVQLERGELAEARALAEEGLPLLVEGGTACIFFDTLALLAEREGRLTHAALVAGYAEAALECRGMVPHPIEARKRTRLRALLTERLGGDRLARLLAEGAKLSEDEACRLALAKSEPAA